MMLLATHLSKGSRTRGARGPLAPQFLTFARGHFTRIIGCFAASHGNPPNHIVLPPHSPVYKSSIIPLCILIVLLCLKHCNTELSLRVELIHAMGSVWSACDPCPPELQCLLNVVVWLQDKGLRTTPMCQTATSIITCVVRQQLAEDSLMYCKKSRYGILTE